MVDVRKVATRLGLTQPSTALAAFLMLQVSNSNLCGWRSDVWTAEDTMPVVWGKTTSDQAGKL